MTERFSVESLRYADVVADTGSFSSAARVCGVTQPALSNSIAKLEQQLGARLFERSTRGVTTTAFGARLLPLIQRAVAHLDAITAEAARLTEPERSSLHIGVSPLINPQLVARAYSAVAELATPRDLVLREADLAELQQDLQVGKLDLILIPSVAPLPQFEHRIIDAEPIVVVEPEPTDSTAVQLADAADGSFILVPDSCGLTTFTTQLFDSHRLPMQTYPGEAVSYQVLEQWANLGLGTAILPLSKLSSPKAPHRRLHDEDVEVEIFYEAVWDPASPLQADIETLTQRIAQQSTPATELSS